MADICAMVGKAREVEWNGGERGMETESDVKGGREYEMEGKGM